MLAVVAVGIMLLVGIGTILLLEVMGIIVGRLDFPLPLFVFVFIFIFVVLLIVGGMDAVVEGTDLEVVLLPVVVGGGVSLGLLLGRLERVV